MEFWQRVFMIVLVWTAFVVVAYMLALAVRPLIPDGRVKRILYRRLWNG